MCGESFVLLCSVLCASGVMVYAHYAVLVLSCAGRETSLDYPAGSSIWLKRRAEAEDTA